MIRPSGDRIQNDKMQTITKVELNIALIEHSHKEFLKRMPLSKNVSKNIKELYADNKKSGKERGAKGKPRSRKQIIAIAMNAAGKSRKK